MRRSLLVLALAACSVEPYRDPLVFRSGSTVCVEDYTDLVPGTYEDDHDAIQAALDAASHGDIVRFGSSCDATCSACSAETYTLFPDGDESSLSGIHGVTYDGEGSTLAFPDRGDAEWASPVRWWMLLQIDEDLSGGTTGTTVVQDFELDGNSDGMNPGEEESKQRLLALDATTSGSALQAVTVTDVGVTDCTWGGFLVYDKVSVSASSTESDNCHHAWQVTTPSLSELTIDDHTSGAATADDYAIKVETTNGDPVVTIQNSTIYAANAYAMSWTAPAGGELTIDNVTADCDSGDYRRCLNVYQWDAPITVKNSDFNGSDEYATIATAKLGDVFTIQDTTIDGGYVSVGATDSYGAALFAFDGVTWSGGGYLTSGRYYAIRSWRNLTSYPARTIDLDDCDGGADNDVLLLNYGGDAEIDAATIATYNAYGDPQEDEVIRAACLADTACQVTWPSGSYSDTSSFWCGDDTADHDCEW